MQNLVGPGVLLDAVDSPEHHHLALPADGDCMEVDREGQLDSQSAECQPIPNSLKRGYKSKTFSTAKKRGQAAKRHQKHRHHRSRRPQMHGFRPEKNSLQEEIMVSDKNLYSAVTSPCLWIAIVAVVDCRQGVRLCPCVSPPLLRKVKRWQLLKPGIGR